MKLVNKGSFYKLKEVFGPSILAGFTSRSILGCLPDDFSRLLPYIGKDFNFSYMNQLHSQQVVLAKEPGIYQADGLFTEKKGSLLVVKTADCLPILLAEKNKWVGVIHLSWQTAKRGVLDNVPFNLAKAKAFAGVGLRNCCYQVGQEFLKYPAFFLSLEKKGKNFFLNPIKFAKSRLISLGLPKDNFIDLKLCSFCSKPPPFSWRREKTNHRTLSFIGISS